MSDFPVSAEDVRRLARLVESHRLSELTYEEGDLSITLRTAAPVPSSAVAANPPGYAYEQSPASTISSVKTPTGVPIEAPIMGIFYRAPAPGTPSFVEVGDAVEAGQPVGMIEAMKTFSEVLAESAGTVIRIPAENGRLVQPGDPLIVLEAG